VPPIAVVVSPAIMETHFYHLHSFRLLLFLLLLQT